MERWKVSDAEALDLITFPGKPGKSGNRPRFRFITKQARLVSYLLEVMSRLPRSTTPKPSCTGRSEPRRFRDALRCPT
jgi:hypothetical protein